MDKGKKTNATNTTIRDHRDTDTNAPTDQAADTPTHHGDRYAPITPVDGYTRDRRALDLDRDLDRDRGNPLTQQILDSDRA